MPRKTFGRLRPVVLPAALFAAIGAPAAAQCPASQTRYSIVDLETLGGAVSSALDLDDAGRAVGGSLTAAGHLHPFLWKDGVMSDLGTLGGPSGSAAGGINAVGEITGQSDNAAGQRRAFLYANGVMVELPTLDGRDGRGFDINDLGQVVGISTAANGHQHAFLYDSDTGALSDLGVGAPGDNSSTANAINLVGQIAAWSGPSANPAGGARAYLYESGAWTPLGTLGGSRSVAYGLDDSGRVVGWSDTAGDTSDHAFLWENGVMRDLGTLGGPSSVAAGAHASGPVVGGADAPDGSQRAFVLAGGEMADLNTLIPAGTGWELDLATAVNASGQIAGRGAIGGEFHAYIATPATATVDDLSGLVESFELPKGTGNSLLVKLDRAREALGSCNPAGACAPLGAFLNEVEAQSGKKLTTAQADALLSMTLALRVTLGCP